MVSKFVKQKYQEMKNLGQTEDFLDEKKFGKLKIFINIKPKDVMMSFDVGDDKVYIGTN